MSLRIAMYSHNGFGLGHIRRNLLLAEGLLRRRPNADVLVITGSAGLHAFPLSGNVDYVKLPSVRKLGTRRWRPYNLDMAMEHLLSIRRTMILESVRAYRPHLFVADFLPEGVEGELLPALEELEARSDARAVIGFRDILDDPDTIRTAWKEDGTYDVLDKLYNLVLIYGDPQWFDFSHYGLDPGIPRYVGLLANERGPQPRGIRETASVLATCGGGADGYPVLAAALEGTHQVHSDLKPIRCTAVTGPLMPQADFDRLNAIAKRVNGRVHRVHDRYQSKLLRTTAMIAMAGYNTVCDILSLRMPALIIPRPGPSGEQTIRAQILAERGLAKVLKLADCTDREVAQAIGALLGDWTFPEEAMPRLGGLGPAVDALLEILE